LTYFIINILGHNFTFGSPGKFEFNFSGIRPKSPTKQPKSPGSVGANVSGGSAAADGSDSELEEDEGEHICFQVCFSVHFLNLQISILKSTRYIPRQPYLLVTKS
jgi:hypothetical protein